MVAICFVSVVNWHYRFWILIALAGMILLIAVGLLQLARRILLLSVQPRQWKIFLLLTKVQIRVSRLLFVVLSIAYVPLTKTAVIAFSCVSSPAGVVHALDTSISCTSPDHAAVQAVAIVILVIVTALYPVILSTIVAIDVVKHKGEIEGHRAMDRHEVLSGVFESYRPEYAYFEGIVLLRKAAMAIIIVAYSTSTESGDKLIESIVCLVFACMYLAIITIFRPFVPVPIPPDAKRARFIADMLNWIEIVSSVAVVLSSCLAVILACVPQGYVTIGLSVFVSLVVGVAGIGGGIAVAFPFVYKRIRGRKFDGPTATDDKDQDEQNIYSPFKLLGLADGRWLMTMEEELNDIVEGKTGIDPLLRCKVAGAYSIWIDRLNGRLDRRGNKIAIFAISSEYTPSTSRHSSNRVMTLVSRQGKKFSVCLETLKFQKGIKDAKNRIQDKDGGDEHEVELDEMKSVQL